ncbi:MAG: XshC-Cox1-family protein [Gammaproteobacteria bacterium HGW-Gammaproteobacteria-3]|nr:MAG: XshC-Cox1-family protein [Gammaproteobacteria bacterium HGW-Gammaproteobacteria-3]
MAQEVFDIISQMRADEQAFAIATVVETRGSVSAKTSAKAVIDQNGEIIAGWVGGGCAESTTCRQALECMQIGETAMIEIDLDDEILGAGMPCGGSMRVYVEPVLPRPALWIMGHGRIAECLCLMGDLLGLRVIVNDPCVSRDKYPQAAKLINDDLDYAQLQPRADDYVVIATQHKGDHESMKRALSSSAAYIALIASRKRSRLVLDYLRADGIEADQIERVVAPSGLDLGARTPEEIALSVMSEIVLLRRGGSGMRLREKLQHE